MKFFRHLLGITKWNKEKNQSIREKTGAQTIVKEIKQYQKKWLQHVQRMGANRIPKQALQYRPKGRSNIGRPGWMVNATHRPLYLREREPVSTLQEAGSVWTVAENLELTGIRSPDRPARSKLYQCHCVEWVSSKNKMKCKNYVLWHKVTQL